MTLKDWDVAVKTASKEEAPGHYLHDFPNLRRSTILCLRWCPVAIQHIRSTLFVDGSPLAIFIRHGRPPGIAGQGTGCAHLEFGLGAPGMPVPP